MKALEKWNNFNPENSVIESGADSTSPTEIPKGAPEVVPEILPDGSPKDLPDDLPSCSTSVQIDRSVFIENWLGNIKPSVPTCFVEGTLEGTISPLMKNKEYEQPVTNIECVGNEPADTDSNVILTVLEHFDEDIADQNLRVETLPVSICDTYNIPIVSIENNSQNLSELLQDSKTETNLPECPHFEEVINEKISDDETNYSDSEKFSDFSESGSEYEPSSTDTDKYETDLCQGIKKVLGHDTDIVVKTAKKKDTGKRIRDKGHCCLFCDKLVINIARHYKVKHGNETQVLRIIVLPKGSKRRREGFEELTKTGDFYHNCQVMNLKEGELILVRRPAEKEKRNFRYSKYSPCPQCLGFMMKKRLWHHVKFNCKSGNRTNESNSKRNLISRALP